MPVLEAGARQRDGSADDASSRKLRAVVGGHLWLPGCAAFPMGFDKSATWIRMSGAGCVGQNSWRVAVKTSAKVVVHSIKPSTKRCRPLISKSYSLGSSPALLSV